MTVFISVYRQGNWRTKRFKKGVVEPVVKASLCLTTFHCYLEEQNWSHYILKSITIHLFCLVTQNQIGYGSKEERKEEEENENKRERKLHAFSLLSGNTRLFSIWINKNGGGSRTS